MLQSRVNVGSIVDKANLMQQSSCGKEESYSISELERKSNRLCIGHCSADIRGKQQITVTLSSGDGLRVS